MSKRKRQDAESIHLTHDGLQADTLARLIATWEERSLSYDRDSAKMHALEYVTMYREIARTWREAARELGTAAKAAGLLVLLLTFTGCAAYRPIVDLQGRSAYQYESDLRDCQNYAAQIDAGTHALVGAGIGAGLGAALGAVLGDAGTGAALGAITGGASGLGQGVQSQADVVRRCLSGRGYSVLQ